MANDRFGTEYEEQRKLLLATTLGGVAAGVLGLKKVLGPEVECPYLANQNRYNPGQFRLP